jgi:cytochrome c oxidase assembly factor CtaG
VSAPVAVRPDGAASEMVWLAVLGGVLGVAVLVGPLSSLAQRSETANALQFAVLALAVPALVVLGAPWRHFAPLGRRAAARAARARRSSGFAALCVQVAIVVAWRMPAAVRGVQQHRWLLAFEVVTLVAAGIALWLELVRSSPMVPSTTPGRRIVLAAAAMWGVWIVAYVAGMAHGQGYPGVVHHPGHGLSGAADQQLATALLWAAAAAAYGPVVFFNLFAWLGAEERAASGAAAWRLRPDRGPTDEVRSAH